MERSLFGTDGMRGKANIYPMTCEVALALGRAVAHYFHKAKGGGRPVIVIGKDTRLSCYMIEQAFAAGVCSQGGKAILTGPLPTPGVAFVTQSMRAQAGIMISASHNNFADNGIKIFDANGNKLPDEVEGELERMVLDPTLLPTKLDTQLGRALRLNEAIGRYIVHVKSAFPSDYDMDGLRIVVDCAHGAAYKVAPLVFEELGAEVVAIGASPNGQNINDYVGSTHPDFCAQMVTKYRADLGICLDGDGDRVVIIDNAGGIMEGDKIIGCLAHYLKDKGEFGKSKEVVGTVMSNIGLENYLKRLGLKLVRTKVGDRYIVEYMRQSGAIFGGEPSGHLIFNNDSTTGDGILAALKVIECMKYYDVSLKSLCNRVELYPQVLKNIPVKSKPDFKTVPFIEKTLKDVEKELGVHGRVLLRYSGTESMARVMMEGKNNVLLQQLCERLVHAVQKELG